MWTTTFKQSGGGVEELTHDFGNNVRVVSNLKERTMYLMHGEVIKKEYPLELDIDNYSRFLKNVEIGLQVKNDK